MHGCGRNLVRPRGWCITQMLGWRNERGSTLTLPNRSEFPRTTAGRFHVFCHCQDGKILSLRVWTCIVGRIGRAVFTHFEPHVSVSRPMRCRFAFPWQGAGRRRVFIALSRGASRVACGDGGASRVCVGLSMKLRLDMEVEGGGLLVAFLHGTLSFDASRRVLQRVGRDAPVKGPPAAKLD
jgi:hypothetical protein